MILRFKNEENYINIDTAMEEQSEGRVSEKRYIEVSKEDFEKISMELDFNQYAFVNYLITDKPAGLIPNF